MENLRPQEEKIIKDIKNLFKLKKEQNDTAIKDIRNPFISKKEVKGLKDIKNHFQYEKEKKIKLDKIRPYLREIVNDLKQSDTWKIQLTTTINFISSKDDNDKERVMHSKSDNTEIMISDEADEVIKNFSIHLKIYFKIIYNQRKVVGLYSIMFSYCIINVI